MRKSNLKNRKGDSPTLTSPDRENGGRQVWPVSGGRPLVSRDALVWEERWRDFIFPLIRKRHVWESLSDAPYRLRPGAEQVGRWGTSVACWRKGREAAQEVGRRDGPPVMCRRWGTADSSWRWSKAEPKAMEEEDDGGAS
jgi:hypothetical protein